MHSHQWVKYFSFSLLFLAISPSSLSLCLPSLRERVCVRVRESERESASTSISALGFASGWYLGLGSVIADNHLEAMVYILHDSRGAAINIIGKNSSRWGDSLSKWNRVVFVTYIMCIHAHTFTHTIHLSHSVWLTALMRSDRSKQSDNSCCQTVCSFRFFSSLVKF